jgi:P27 family predicted phage terminase small subunit
MKRKSDIPPPPKNLKSAGKELWTAVAGMFELEEHHQAILFAACCQCDRASQAKALLDKEPLVAKDRFGQPKAHPGIEVERQAALACTRLLRELGLDSAAVESTIRSHTRRGA